MMDVNNLFQINIEEEYLSDRKLINDYWALNDDGEFVFKVKDLQKESGLRRQEILKISKGSWITALNTKCVVCSASYKISSRTELRGYIGRGFSVSKNERPYKCAECKTKLEEERTRLRLHKAAEKREQVDKILNNDPIRSIDFDEIPLVDVLYLLALLRGGANEKITSIMAINRFDKPLTPSKYFDYEVVSYLHDCGYIGIDPVTDISLFQLTEDGLRYHPINVCWRPLFANNGEEVGKILGELMEIVKKFNWPEHWLTESEEVWKKIALNEGLEYLVFVLSEHGISYEPKERASQVISHLLKDFSVAEICCVIWSQMNNTAGSIARNNVPIANAPNYLLKCMQSFGDRALKDNWNIKKFHRNFECPISLVAEIYYDKILQIDGFSEVPKI